MRRFRSDSQTRTDYVQSRGKRRQGSYSHDSINLWRMRARSSWVRAALLVTSAWFCGIALPLAGLVLRAVCSRLIQKTSPSTSTQSAKAISTTNFHTRQSLLPFSIRSQLRRTGSASSHLSIDPIVDARRQHQRINLQLAYVCNSNIFPMFLVAMDWITMTVTPRVSRVSTDTVRTSTSLRSQSQQSR